MAALQHYLNSLHVFCFLLTIGMGRKKAMKFARVWERFVHPMLYPVIARR